MNKLDSAVLAQNISGENGTLSAQAKSVARSAFGPAKHCFFGPLCSENSGLHRGLAHSSRREGLLLVAKEKLDVANACGHQALEDPNGPANGDRRASWGTTHLFGGFADMPCYRRSHGDEFFSGTRV